jgi:hypothetical protein
MDNPLSSSQEEIDRTTSSRGCPSPRELQDRNRAITYSMISTIQRRCTDQLLKSSSRGSDGTEGQRQVQEAIIQSMSLSLEVDQEAVLEIKGSKFREYVKSPAKIRAMIDDVCFDDVFQNGFSFETTTTAVNTGTSSARHTRPDPRVSQAIPPAGMHEPNQTAVVGKGTPLPESIAAAADAGGIPVVFSEHVPAGTVYMINRQAEAMPIVLPDAGWRATGSDSKAPGVIANSVVGLTGNRVPAGPPAPKPAPEKTPEQLNEEARKQGRVNRDVDL